MELGERLARVEERLARIEDHLTETLERHDRLLFGHNGFPGFLTELDRLKGDAQRRGKAYAWVASLLSAIVTGLVVVQFRG